MEDLEYITKKYNRVKKTQPQSDKSHWCIGCDRNLISEGQKCGVCGHKDKSKHQKI